MIIGVIQARMSSRRLPGKVLELLGGKPMIERQVERTSLAGLDELIVATSTDSRDSPLCAELDRIGTRYSRGALDDVLDRVYQAAASVGADHVVRLTADCPLTDYRIIDRVLEAHLAQGNDYTSNTLERTYPDGLDVEVATIAALEAAWRECTDPEQREHVTPYLYTSPDRFKLGNVDNAIDYSRYRLTVDYPEDLVVVRTVFDILNAKDPGFSCADMVALLERRPDLVELNAAYNFFLDHDPAPMSTP